MKIDIRQPLTFSEIGRKDNQEDNVYPSPERLTTENRFFVLCDGMGGHDSGEVASDTVCRALGEYFETHQPTDGMVTPDYFKLALAYAYDELDKKDTGAIKKMGTTMTCLYLHSKGYLVAHIGDSRIYHVRPENTDLEKGRLGIIYQSSDHSLVNDLLKAGELTEEEAANFPQKNVITRAMQPNLERRYRADVFSFSDIKAGDYFFLCSDGVLEQLTNERLCEILASPISDEEKLEAIKQVCYGKTKDNYTCFLIPISHVVAEVSDVHDDSDDIIAGVVLEHEAEEQRPEAKVAEHPAQSQTVNTRPAPQQAAPSKPLTKSKNPFSWIRLTLILFVCISLVCVGLTLKKRQTPPGKDHSTPPSTEVVQRKQERKRTPEKEKQTIPLKTVKPTRRTQPTQPTKTTHVTVSPEVSNASGNVASIDSMVKVAMAGTLATEASIVEAPVTEDSVNKAPVAEDSVAEAPVAKAKESLTEVPTNELVPADTIQ